MQLQMSIGSIDMVRYIMPIYMLSQYSSSLWTGILTVCRVWKNILTLRDQLNSKVPT